MVLETVKEVNKGMSNHQQKSHQVENIKKEQGDGRTKENNQL